MFSVREQWRGSAQEMSARELDVRTGSRSNERDFMRLSSRVSIVSATSQGGPVKGEHASPRGSASYGHSAAIEMILARAASNSRADLNGRAYVQQARGPQNVARFRNAEPRVRCE
jgi:hypothetical protein